MSDWFKRYVYGDYTVLLNWMIATFPNPDWPNSRKPYRPPFGKAWISNAVKPQEVDSVVVYKGKSHTIYKAKDPAVDNNIICLVAVTDEALFNGCPGTVLNKTASEMEALYPEFVLGQSMPRIEG